MSQGNVLKVRFWPWLYFALALAPSWLFWIPAAIFSQFSTSFPIGVLNFAGGFGPAISGVILVQGTKNET